MKTSNNVSRKAVAIILVLSICFSFLTGCSAKTDRYTSMPAIMTAAIAQSISSSINLPEKRDNLEDYNSFSADWFVYEQIFNDYSTLYDAFPAALKLKDGSEILGIGFTDYSAYYEAEDGSIGYFPSGFIADVGETIPKDEAEDGLIIENLDYSDGKYEYVFAYEVAPYYRHCVIHEQYIKYGIDSSGGIVFETQPYQRGYCDETLGALYSYDEGRFVYDPDEGNFIGLTGVSLSEAIDYDQLEFEINTLISQQDENFVQEEILTQIYIAKEAIDSYLLSMQKETFLGCDVAELISKVQELDPAEYIRFTPDGQIVVRVESSIIGDSDSVAKWMIGIGCGIAVIGSTALNIFFPAARPLCGAITGAAIDVFIQVVIENQTVENINWKKVAVAAVSGATMAWLCPLAASQITDMANNAFGSEILSKLSGYGILTLSNSMVSGATAYANAVIDETGDEFNAFLAGAALGATCTVAAASLAEAASTVGPRLTELLSKTRPGMWLNRVSGKTAFFIADHQVHISESIESILSPKSIHEAAKQAIFELNGQVDAKGGCYTSLATSGTQRHEMPSFSSVSSATGVQSRNEAKLPAIRMSLKDHRKTASYGISNEAREYCKRQAKLWANHQYHAAIQMDIDDIMSKFGTKYNEHIRQMIEYAISKGWW